MLRLIRRCGPLALAFLLLTAPFVVGQAPPEDSSADQQAIRQAAARYLEAAQRNDTEAMAKAWTADGDYIDAAGNRVQAWLAIQQAGKSEEKALPRGVVKRPSQLRFVAPNVAVEDGVAELGSGPSANYSRYTAVWVKEQGQWLLDSLRESALDGDVAGNEPVRSNLEDLSWLEGEWVARLGGATYEFSGELIADKQSLRRRFTVRVDGALIVEGTQYVTLDPQSGAIISHAVDSNGTVTDGTWKRDDDGSWVVQYAAETVDRTPLSATHIYIPQADGGWTWTAVDATVDGAASPEMTLKFQKQAAR